MSYKGHWQDISRFAYSKRSHLDTFDIPPSFERLLRDDRSMVLKVYQDLFIYSFIVDNIPFGSRILEIGGGHSRVATLISDSYDYWIADKYEGLGNGPKTVPNLKNVTIAEEYIGEFSPLLEDNSFDCVFSISVWEHFPQSKPKLTAIITDIHRILRAGGISVHCVDVVDKHGELVQQHFIDMFYDIIDFPHRMFSRNEIVDDKDLFFMKKEAYDRNWKDITKQSYEQFGTPISYNVVYRKEDFNPQTKRPLVTIVTVSLNAVAELEKTIQSVICQTYKKVEYIIIDGESTDGTIELVESYKDKIDFYLSEPDRGIYHAMNKGIERANGEWINFLNAGDILIDENVIQETFSLPYGDSDLIYGDTIFRKESGAEILAKAQPFATFWRQINLCHNSLFSKTSLLKEHAFDESYRIVADSGFIGICIKTNKRFYYTAAVITVYSLGGFGDKNSILRTIERWKLMLELDIVEDRKVHEYYFNRLITDKNFKQLSLSTSSDITQTAGQNAIRTGLARLKKAWQQFKS